MTDQQIDEKIAALKEVLNQNLGNLPVVSAIVLQISELENSKRGPATTNNS